MADRLAELARQRALLSEHLTWLDGEIADETVKRLIPKPLDPAATAIDSSAPPPSAPATATTPTDAAVHPVPISRAAVPEPAEILDQFRVAPSAVKQDVRKGCLLYFAAAFVLLGLVVAILYFTIGTHSIE